MAVVRDGSVDNGFEINTSPASGDDFIKQLTELGDALANQGAGVNASCGLHCHVDARDYNFYDVKKLALLWRMVEPALYRLCHPSRKTSSYCKPCGAQFVNALENGKIPKDVKKSFFKGIYGQEPGRELNRKAVSEGSKYNNARYAALNLHSWLYRGTVENRMHHGTVNTEKMIRWGLLNAYLLDYASTNTESHIRSLHTFTPSREPTAKQAMKVLLRTLEGSPELHDWWRARFDAMELVHAGPLSSCPIDP